MSTLKKTWKQTSKNTEEKTKDCFKGHRTKKHFINAVHEEEAEQEIQEVMHDTRKPNC